MASTQLYDTLWGRIALTDVQAAGIRAMGFPAVLVGDAGTPPPMFDPILVINNKAAGAGGAVTLTADDVDALPASTTAADLGALPAAGGTITGDLNVIGRIFGTQRSAAVVVAAANSTAAGRKAADYVCTGTQAAGGDEVTINQAIAALTGPLTNGFGGRVVLLEGDYWLTQPVVCDQDNATIEGQGAQYTTRLHTATNATNRQAALIVGKTRTTNGVALRNLAIKAGDNSSNIITGSGSGIVFRSSNGRMENVTVENTEKDGVWIDGSRTSTGTATTLAAAVSTTPNPNSSETWTVASTAGIPIPSLAVVGPDPQHLFAEVVRITAAPTGTTLTVTRGFWGTPVTAHANGDALTVVTIDSLFEVAVTNLTVIQPGQDCLTITPSILNSEFTRVIAHGGKQLGTPRGRDGIHNMGGGNKFLLCHPYWNVRDGLRCDLTSNGNDQVFVHGGEYETNGGYGIWLNGSSGSVVNGTLMYSNANKDIYLSGTARKLVVSDNILQSSTVDKHILVGGTNTNVIISGNVTRFGTAAGIAVESASVAQVVICGNSISEGNGSTGISLVNAQQCEVYGNTVDRGIIESGTADYNRIHGNVVGTGGSGAVTRIGAHSSAHDNKGAQSVASVTANYTTFSRETVLANANGGAITVTLPPGAAGTMPSGTECRVVKIDGSANAVTIAAPSGFTVNGVASITLTAANSGKTLTLFGTNWTAY